MSSALLNELDVLIQKQQSLTRAIFKKTLQFRHFQSEDTYQIESIVIPEEQYMNQNLPIKARGLFIHDDPHKGKVIVARGYDKFFNINQTAETTISSLRKSVVGPFEVCVKENGCIILVSVFKGELLVTSKHSFGSKQDSTMSHADKGREWLDKIVSDRNCREDLISFLQHNNLTAVFEVNSILKIILSN